MSAKWSPDGMRVLTTSFDKTARVWTVDLERLLRYIRRVTTATLTPPERQDWLGEDEATARETYRHKEHEHGRSGDWLP